MRRFLGGLLDKTLVNLVYHVESRVKLKKGTPDKPNVYDEVKERAIKRSADYVEAHLSSVLLFYNRKQMWDYAVSLITLSGLNVEFGVEGGDSINHLAEKLNSGGAVIFGFDSFEGLQEDWKGSSSPKGTFGLGGVLPPVRPNVTLVKGWFDKTLPPFLARETERVAFVHLDADTYETTAYLLTTLNPRIVPGTLLLFDEYIGYSGWEHGEYKAFKEFVEKEGRSYEYLAFSHLQALVRIT
jgi:hypothetical protein